MSQSAAKRVSSFVLACIMTAGAVPANVQAANKPDSQNVQASSLGKCVYQAAMQSTAVDGLHYTGKFSFDEETGTLTFLTSGVVQDPDLKTQYAQYETNPELPLDAWYNVFTVPDSVKKIVIGENVTVTGRFDIAHDCTIEGMDRETSVIYGTEQMRYSHNRGDEYGAEWDKPWEYSSIDVIGAATVHVKNLTVQDPYGYCISGYAKDAVIHCQSVNMIDTREGQQNNSDGFVGQAGSSLTDVYIETADDAVKAYHDLTMTDVEIVMLQNGAPIQFGWNADDDEDTDVVIDGLTISTHDDIARYNRGVFSWVSKDNTKVITVTANNVDINVPKANLFEMNPATGTANITMTNATVVTNGEGTNKTLGTVTITPPQQLPSPMDGKVNVLDDMYYDADGAVWDAQTGTLTFTKSGTIVDKSEYDKYYPQEQQGLSLDALYTGWSVPSSVKKIVIEAGVSVNGRFSVKNDLTIEGEDRETSKIYGTKETRYSKKREPVYGSGIIAPYSYSMVDVTGDCVVNVENLTVLDPYGYCISGYSNGAVIHCDSVSMIDSRGGNENNSDGFVGRPGSSLTNCYFETGDDAIKIYRSMTITDCTIKMQENGAPIQMGWNIGDDVDTEVTIRGLDIITDSSIQSYNQGVFAWVSAENTKTIKITADDVNVDVPNASLFVMNPTGGHVDFTFTNFTYNTKDLGYSKVQGTVSINGEIVDLTPEEVEYNGEALYGTPNIDGQVDAIWEKAHAITLDQVRMGVTKAHATYKLVWDEQNLYILADVYADGEINCDNTNGIWENDCIEIFLDVDNTKENTSGGGVGNYDVDDRHILINYLGNKVAYDNKNQVDDVVSATEITDYGYRMEVKVPFRMERAEQNIIGFDGQICSTNGGDKRAAIVGWAGNLNVADQGPASWGNVMLVKETAQTYTVTFNTNGGNTIENAKVENGQKIVKPADPTKDGYIFAGWYTDENLTTKYDFDTEVTGNITLYAKWTQNSSAGGSSSSGGSSTGSMTDTITNPDGSITTIVTKPDGSTTATTKSPNGSSSIVNTTKDGQVKANVTVSSNAVENADGTVALPMPKISVTTDTDKAPTVTVDLPAGTAVKVDIPIDHVTAGTVAILVKADGTEEIIKTSIATKNGIAVKLQDDSIFKIVDNSKSFADVPNSFWAVEAVDFTTSHELFNGTSENTFSPNTEMTRAMIVTVLARLDGVDTSKGDTWYESGQQWAMEQGISDGSNLMDNLTLEQLVAMLYRYVGSPAVSGAFTGFVDTENVSSWAADAMLWAEQNGIITDIGNTLNPQENATRAQVATMLMRLIENL